ncbi:hypothetical protein [Companilactobacillus furfuricola]|uniref:hypothetical protein n=1 Tax=Companilactobacillus furfuricola TaxID=1462575 RepID=UPI0013DDBF83|nr:hypothetical protein [Companilactobacillus furfuricola]
MRLRYWYLLSFVVIFVAAFLWLFIKGESTGSALFNGLGIGALGVCLIVLFRFYTSRH